MSCIYTDLVMHNYQSNQSPFMTRFGTDLHYQYGIFGGKSQMSFSFYFGNKACLSLSCILFSGANHLKCYLMF